MKLFLPKTFSKFLFIVILFVGQQVIGQVNMSATGSHSQNFNALASTGTANAWTNNSTISNWYSQRTGTGTTYEANNGSSTAGNQYSYGATSNSERALGATGSGNAAAGSFAHGVLLRNTSGNTITDIKVTYTLEQWRKSGVTAAQDITFYYRISSSTITALNPNVNTGWTQVTGLTLSSPINTATAATLDGNLTANRVTASNVSIPSLSLANNEYIMLKWEDPDHSGTDHALAIDDVTINWSTAPAGPTVTTTAATSITTNGAILNGSINANGTSTDASFEYGTTIAYGSSETATPSTATGTTATSISATIGSLALNTQYHYRAVGTVSTVPTNGSDLTFYTLAATPGVLVVSNPMQTTLDVTVNATTENSNPASTQYAIQETGGQYVQANGSLGATAVWQTVSVWATTTVTGLNFSTSYTFSAKARNGASVETGFGSSASETTLAAQTVDYAVVQSPNTTQNVLEGGSLTVYIRAYEPGLTTLSGEQSNLFGWVGYSSTNDNPSNPGWTWVPATFNVEAGNDDEYEATLSGLPIGTYYYAGRFQIGSGPYVYAGSAGVWNNDNVTLNINADVVNFANIQSPTSGTITEGTSNFDVYAQVYEPGVTEAAGQGAGISAWIGYSSTDSNPNENDWTWVAAAFNVQVVNNDEYVANIATGLTPGTYYYASRFLKTGSSTYVYGGTNGNWNDDNGVLTVEGLDTPTANDATDITQTQFNANWNAVAGASSYEVDVYTRVGGSVEVIDQTFTWADYSTANGTGGNSGGWSGSIASNTFDISNWTDLLGYKGDNCAKIGTSGGRGALTTPVFGEAGDAVVTFRAGAWDGGTEQTTLLLEITGGGTLSVSSVAMVKGAFSNYNVTITGATALTQLTFRAFQASNARFFIDDINVVVGSEVITPVSGSPFTTSNTTLPVSGLDPQTTYYYVVRAINGSVETVNSNEIEVETKPSVVTWNGTAWSNIDGPDETIDAIIDGVYITGTHEEFTAKKLTVTSGSLTVSSGTSITVEDVLENELTAAAVVVENNANLIQSNDVDNIGSITVERNSSEVMRLDYTLWSSPVAGQNLLGFSPQTMVNRFYVYNPSNDQYATISPSTNSFAEGTGYLIRSPDTHSTTEADWAGTFVGEPHNGDVTISVSNSTYNAVGNPYPSTISANAFITANGLTEALYFWRKTNGAAGSAYATYTFAGGAGTGSSDSNAQVPNGTIQVGQGFIALSTSTSLVFTNQMRTANHQNQFFRNAEDTNRSRIWLNLSNAQNVVGQTLIAYMENTSVDYDAMYDGKYINDSQTAFTSLLNNEEYAVQARGLFSVTDVVPMRFKTEAAGSYTISLAHVDGLFENDEAIFVKDNLAGVEHNLINSSYEFTSVAGAFGDRFEIIYQSTLGVSIPEFGNQTIVFAKDNNLNVQNGSANITAIQVFDVQGRLVLDVKEINSTSYSGALDQISNGVLLVKVFADNGQSTTKKIIK